MIRPRSEFNFLFKKGPIPLRGGTCHFRQFEVHPFEQACPTSFSSSVYFRILESMVHVMITEIGQDSEDREKISGGL